MKDQELISSRQFMLLAVSLVLPTAVLSLPGIAAMVAKQDAWLTPVGGVLAGGVTGWAMLWLAHRFPGLSIIEYVQEVFGRWPGRVIGFLYLWWVVHFAAIVVQEYTMMLDTTILIETPAAVFLGSIVLIAVYLSRHGLEVVARTNEIFLPIVLVSITLIIILAGGGMKLANLRPVLADRGIVDALKGFLEPASWFGEIIMLSMILPMVADTGKVRRHITGAVLATGIILLVATAACIAVFGAELTERDQYPFFSLARQIRVGLFLERLDPVFISMWMLGASIKMTIAVLVAAMMAARLFNLGDYRPLTAPVGLCMATLSAVLFKNIFQMTEFLHLVWPPYALTIFELGIPLLTVSVAAAARKGSVRA